MGERKRKFTLFLPNVTLDDCPDDTSLLENLHSEDFSQIANATEELPTAEEDEENEESDIDFYEEADAQPAGLEGDEPNRDENEKTVLHDILPNLFIARTPAPIENITYEELPDIFIDAESWPKTCNLACWYCGNNFSGPPWFIPLEHVTTMITLTSDDSIALRIKDNNFEDQGVLSRKVKEVKGLRRHGVTCLPLCSVNYIDEVNDKLIPPNKKWQCKQLLTVLCEKMIGLKVTNIPEAEDRYKQIQYIGSRKGISAQEYREVNMKRWEQFLINIVGKK